MFIDVNAKGRINTHHEGIESWRKQQFEQSIRISTRCRTPKDVYRTNCKVGQKEIELFCEGISHLGVLGTQKVGGMFLK
jgi:hypothetical protein